MTEQDSDEPVGYKHPPRRTRFAKGVSGNPSGRPRGAKSLKTDLIEELAETVSVREGEREYTVTKQRAMVKAVVSAACKGDLRAVGALVALYSQLLKADETPAESSSEAEEALEDFIQREIARRALPSNLDEVRPKPNREIEIDE